MVNFSSYQIYTHNIDAFVVVITIFSKYLHVKLVLMVLITLSLLPDHVHIILGTFMVVITIFAKNIHVKLALMELVMFPVTISCTCNIGAFMVVITIFAKH